MKLHPTFTPAFFNPRTFDAPSPAAAQSQKPVLFSDAEHGGSIQRFMASPQFGVCRREYAALIDHIVQFAKDHGDKVKPKLTQETLTTIARDFEKFKAHLADTAQNFFGDHKPIVYGVGKEMLHEFVHLLGDGNISLDKRLNAIQAMAEPFATCSGAITTVLKQVIPELKFRTAGLKGAAYRARIQMTDALILDHVRATHQYSPGNEVHFVNVYFDLVAEKLGMPKRQDAFASIALPQISPEDMKTCTEKVLSRLRPSALASVMADTYLDEIKGVLAKASIDVNATYEDATLTDVVNRTRTFAEAALDSEFGPVSQENYLRPVPDTLAEYRLAKQSTLIAKDFLSELQEHGLVDHADAIRLTPADASQGSIKMLGKLFWRDDQGECTELELEHLLSVSPRAILEALQNDQVAAEAHGAIFKAIVNHVTAAAIEKDRLREIPETWLGEFAGILAEGKITSSENWIAPVLALAVKANATIAMQALITAGADIHAVDDEGRTVVMEAARHGSAEALDELIKAGANVETESPEGVSLLMIAAHFGHSKVAQLLIDHKINVNARGPENCTAVYFAAEAGHVEILRLLIENEAEVIESCVKGVTPLQQAATKGHADIVQLLIEHGADFRSVDPEHFTPVMLAAYHGRLDVLRVLVDKGANIDVADAGVSNRSTPAMLAAQKNQLHILDFLIEKKVNLNAQDAYGATAAIAAARNGHAEALRALINANADLDVQDSAGDTATILAANNGQLAVLQASIDGGANLDIQDRLGNTAVHVAARNGNLEMLQALINAGANLDLQDMLGYTAAINATNNGQLAVLQALIDGGANLDIQNFLDDAAVHVAAKNGNLEMLQALIDGGANLDIRNRWRDTAAIIATKKGHPDILQALNNAKANLHATNDEGASQRSQKQTAKTRSLTSWLQRSIETVRNALNPRRRRRN